MEQNIFEIKKIVTILVDTYLFRRFVFGHFRVLADVIVVISEFLILPRLVINE